MDLRVSRGAVALAVLPLSTGALAVLSPVMSGSATAACAPSLAVAQHAKAKKKPKVHAAKPVASKLRKKKYVAKVAITAKQGTATVVVAQSVCPDGAAGAAASTTQSASGKGVVTKSVSAKGHSKKAAKKAAKAKAKKAVAKLKKKGATKKGRKKAEERAVAVVRPVATQKAHDALYLSDLVYLSVDANSYRVTSTPPAGHPTMTLAQATNGDLTLSVPAGFNPDAMTVAFACVRPAPAWPTSYLFDGGSASSPQLPSYAAQQSDPAGVRAVLLSGVADGTSVNASTANQSEQWFGYWTRKSATDHTVSYEAGLTKGQAAFAGSLVCFDPNGSAPEPGAYTETLHGPHVGTTVSAPDSNIDVHVLGGIPVRLR